MKSEKQEAILISWGAGGGWGIKAGVTKTAISSSFVRVFLFGFQTLCEGMLKEEDLEVKK